MNYLYNGMELPPLPSWDKSKYPHAYISKATDTGAVYLYVTNLAMHYNSSLGSVQLTAFSGGAPEYLVFTADGNAFLPTESYPGKLGNGGVAADSANTDIVWANADVYYLSDSTMLYRSADSDPIPVTSAPAPDPFWLTMGWLVGRAVAGLRGKKETAEPVAYLYNGVLLPALPKVPDAYIDRFEYVALVNDGYESFPRSGLYVIYSDAPLIRYDSNVLVARNPVNVYVFGWSAGEVSGSWVDYGASEQKDPYGEDEWYFVRSAKNVVWVSFDMDDTSGTLYLAASDPVPVYE